SAIIGLGPVQLPEYLDRPELVIRTSPNGFELSETDRWAEPLADNFRHILANDLTNLLGTTNIVQYPWYPGTRLDYIVRVQVQRFEINTSKSAELVARWELTTSQVDQPVATHDVHLSHATASLTGDSAAAALSEDVGELAGQIALTISQMEQQRLARGLR
ncbi:MAG: membrane integrity-associated transporter subunit PqiC, partial [Deltaproteobacteria bacterium]|nr:membrane integrity-associated transporter subunit PqiC [Deltaproteobacteria bacterium]